MNFPTIKAAVAEQGERDAENNSPQNDDKLRGPYNRVILHIHKILYQFITYF